MATGNREIHRSLRDRHRRRHCNAQPAKLADDSFFKITNYELLRQDLPRIERISPDLIVLDEAQRIKNWKTRTAQVVKRLPSQYAIVLTGTPLENRLEELHSIVEFVDRFRLGPSFKFLHEHQQLDNDGRVVGYRNLNAISQTLEPIMIRRTKQEVLSELPAAYGEKPVRSDDARTDGVSRIESRNRRPDREPLAKDKISLRIRSAPIDLRASEHADELQQHVSARPGNRVRHEIRRAGGQLCDVLESRDAKAVVFSQWTRSHELLRRRLNQREIGHVMFHGGVPGPQRKDLVARFKDESRLPRVSLNRRRRGGIESPERQRGLHMDLPWNPAVLEQRIGRVHRLGQSRPVHVFNFVSQGTIEHGMLDLLKFKKSLFAGVLDGRAG